MSDRVPACALTATLRAQPGTGILDVNIPPGDTTLDHVHNDDIATVSMTAGTNTRTQAPGQPWSQVRPRRSIGHVNVTEYSGKPESHRVENVGDSPYQLFAVENLWKNGWSAAAPVTALATTPTAESRAFRVYDVRLTREPSQTSHSHTALTIAVLISGKVLSEGSDKQAKAYAPAAVGLKQLDGPGQWVLVPPGESHHVTRLGIGDAHVIEIEVR